jgi:hypothetical protein
MPDGEADLAFRTPLVHWLRPVATTGAERLDLPVRLLRARYATPRAAREFRFLVRSADRPAVLAALRRTLVVWYVDNPEYFGLAAAVEHRARALDVQARDVGDSPTGVT